MTSVILLFQDIRKLLCKAMETLITYPKSFTAMESLYFRLTACTRSNPSAIYQFYEYGYMDMAYQDLKLTELSIFPSDIIQTSKLSNKDPSL